MTSGIAEKTAPSAGEKSNIGFALMPPVFVLLWSSGFVATRYGLSHIGPFAFLCLRFWLAAGLLLPMMRMLQARWPNRWPETAHIAVAGVLFNCGIAGMFFSVSKGTPLGLVGLIGGLQPLLTGLLAGPLLGERVVPRQWLGLMLGLAGVVLVLWERIGIGGISAAGIISAGLGLLGLTLGTLYQKRFCEGMNLIGGTAIQLVASAIVMGLLASVFESWQVDWAPPLIFSLLWMAIPLSIGATTLLWLIIRRGAASTVASLFYMIPPVTAALAWLFFDEHLGFVAIAGMTVSAIGVALVTAKR